MPDSNPFAVRKQSTVR